jgi:hypothetical protein
MDMGDQPAAYHPISPGREDGTMLRNTLYYPRTLKQIVRGSLRVLPIFIFYGLKTL